MANALFNQLNQSSMMQQFQAFKQNPMQCLLNNKINIPEQFMNDPKGAVQYLMNNGQMSQAQFDKISKLAQQMGIKI